LIAALGTLGFNLAGLLGTAGVAGLAVGFGAQKLVRDVMTGFSCCWKISTRSAITSPSAA
jgi:small-conductance mechanosensitive channel